MIGKNPTKRGFSLLELMIAMFILIILLSVALPTYQRSVQYAKRRSSKKTSGRCGRRSTSTRPTKGKYPPSLESLVEGKYLREMPIDPILEKAEWESVNGRGSLNPDGGDGLTDVKSKADGQDSEGKAYKDY